MNLAINNTPIGTIDIQLYDDQAPITVANFLRYAGRGYYSSYIFNGVISNAFIYRLVPGNIIQGGGYDYANTTNVPGSAYNAFYSHNLTDPPIPNEFSPLRSNIRGTIAMAKTPGDPNSATSDWFINVTDNSGSPNTSPPGFDYQNGGFTVFGNVVDNAQDPGMTIVDAIANNLGRVNTTAPLFMCSDFCNLTPPNPPISDLNSVPVANYNTAIGLDPSNLVMVTSIPNVISTPTIQGTGILSVIGDIPGPRDLQMTYTADVDMTFTTAQTFTATTPTTAQSLLTTFTPPPNETAQFNDGIFKFSVTWVQGPTSRIVTLLNDDPATANHYYAYGPTSDNPAYHWYDFAYDGTTGAEFVGNKILLHFVDGQRGDNDTTPNRITHIGAPVAVTPISSSSTSGCTIAAMPSQTTNNGDWVVISLFLTFVALVRRRARRERI